MRLQGKTKVKDNEVRKASGLTPNPVDEVIRKVREMLHSGELQPGERLPAERKLSERFGISRLHVRQALQKLESYGIIKTYPQSGSVVAGLKIQALEGLITDMLKIDMYDFRSLVETRIMLEANVIRLCAERRNDADIRTIREASDDFIRHFNTPLRVEKDFIFHRAIAQGSHNEVLKSMLLTITPDILHYYNKHKVCKDSNENVISEHLDMLRFIIARDGDKAERIMLQHLKHLDEFSRTVSSTDNIFLH